MSRVEVFTTPFCGYCTAAKALLRGRGIEFQEIDISRDDALADDIVQRSGQRTVPQIFIDNKPIGGYTELAKLDRSGELAKLVK
jgi:glutaredoxin 3